jgi:rhamnosyl/mannosyltransferase
MKVLQLGKFYPPDIGGIETIIYEITEGLNKSGIKCDVLCSNSKNEYKEETIEKNGYKYKVYRTKSLGKILSTSITPQMIFKLREIIDSYDIIHIHHPDPMANFSLFLSNPKKQKIVVHWHMDIIKQKISLKFYMPLLKWMLKKADIVIGTSPTYIEESEQLSGFKGKCILIPLGINKDALKPDKNKVIEIKNKFLSKKIIFSLGRFVYYKGFEYLIKASLDLPDNYVVLIGGDGPLKDKYIDLINRNRLNTKVFLIGKVPSEDLASYYDACDIFCLPSVMKAEAFGLVMVEAMSFGKPIVATKIKGSGVAWVNQHGITGLNVEPKNPKALAEAIMFILENPDVYKTFSKNAIDRFYKEFTADTMVKRIVKLYESFKS